MTTITHYNAEAYNTLPTLGEAAAQLKAYKLLSLIEGPIRDFFLQTGLYTTCGIVLLHKHFDLAAHDRLVEHGYTSTAWRGSGDGSTMFERYGGHVVPRSFRLLGDKLDPFEFAYRPGMTAEKSLDMSKALKAGELLRTLKVDNFLGLRHLEGRNPDFNVEVTENNANIMIPRDAADNDKLIPAVWIFGPNDDDRCNCNEYCSKESWGHVKTHGCG